MLSLLRLQLYFESDRKSLRLHGSASGPTSLYAAVTLEPQKAKSPKKMIFQQCDYDQMLFRLPDTFIRGFFYGRHTLVLRETLTTAGHIHLKDVWSRLFKVWCVSLLHFGSFGQVRRMLFKHRRSITMTM